SAVVLPHLMPACRKIETTQTDKTRHKLPRHASLQADVATINGTGRFQIYQCLYQCLRAFVTKGTIPGPAVCGNTPAADVACNLLHSAASFLVVPDHEYGVRSCLGGSRTGAQGASTVS